MAWWGPHGLGGTDTGVGFVVGTTVALFFCKFSRLLHPSILPLISYVKTPVVEFITVFQQVLANSCTLVRLFHHIVVILSFFVQQRQPGELFNSTVDNR